MAELREAIGARIVPPLPTLLRMLAETFYGDDESLHYARARGLCRHLQAQKLLRPFYAAFRRAQATAIPPASGRWWRGWVTSRATS